MFLPSIMPALISARPFHWSRTTEPPFHPTFCLTIPPAASARSGLCQSKPGLHVPHAPKLAMAEINHHHCSTTASKLARCIYNPSFTASSTSRPCNRRLSASLLRPLSSTSARRHNCPALKLFPRSMNPHNSLFGRRDISSARLLVFEDGLRQATRSTRIGGGLKVL